MSEPSQNPDESPIASAKRGIRWDAMAAIIASLVGLLALVVAGYTAYIQRQQVRAQVWPYLIGVHSGGRSELVWVNKGVGPAIVRSVVVTADGKILRNWKDVFRVLGILGAVYDQSFLNGNVLSAGETLPWIQANANRTRTIVWNGENDERQRTSSAEGQEVRGAFRRRRRQHRAVHGGAQRQ